MEGAGGHRASRGLAGDQAGGRPLRVEGLGHHRGRVGDHHRGRAAAAVRGGAGHGRARADRRAHGLCAANEAGDPSLLGSPAPWGPRALHRRGLGRVALPGEGGVARHAGRREARRPLLAG
eukprot:781471-Lingulodinium_polyedra.AAC.1